MCLVVSRTYLPLAAVMYVCADSLPNGYSHAAVALGKKLFPMFALALDLNEDFFDDKVLRRHLVRQVHSGLGNGSPLLVHFLDKTFCCYHEGPSLPTSNRAR